MTLVDASRAQSIEERFPEVFHQPFLKRFGPLLMLIGVILYGVYTVWFFDVPKLVAEARWERFGIYMSQWISYDVQPEFRISGGQIDIRYPRFSPLGDNPNPDWVKHNSDGSLTVAVSGNSRSVTIGKTETILTAHGTTVVVDMSGEHPKVQGEAPYWMTVYDTNVIANMGFAGDVSISANRVKVRKRFLGWANFVFDTHSPFFDKPVGEVVSLIVSGPELKPGTSNLALAFDNIWNNSAWQHGDVWTKLFQTIVMAFLGTLLGSVAAFPLAFLAARNITPNRLLNQLLKRFFDFLRSVDMLIWALFFTRSFGPGPIPGIAAIFFTDAGALGKVYAEAVENVDDKQREGVKSVGASPVIVNRFGVVPQVLPVFISQSLYFWESNTRSATVIGAVGAGGIGLKLLEAMGTNADWDKVAYMVLLILFVVFLFDNVSNAIRSRLIGGPTH